MQLEAAVMSVRNHASLLAMGETHSLEDERGESPAKNTDKNGATCLSPVNFLFRAICRTSAESILAIALAGGESGHPDL